MLALQNETVARVDPVTVGRAEADGWRVNLFIDAQHRVSLVENLQGLGGTARKAAVDDHADFPALVQIDPAPCGETVDDVMQTVLERRVIGQPRAIQITLQAEADAAHGEAIAQQQNLLAGGDPELQVFALAHQRQHA